MRDDSPRPRDTRPRRFNRLLTIQTMPEAQDATTGEISPVPTYMCQRWGQIEPLMGRELINAKEVQADVTHKVDIYSDSTTRTIVPQMRLTYNGRVFNILAVLNLGEMDRRMQLLCKEQILA